jgi:hypothetical protein
MSENEGVWIGYDPQPSYHDQSMVQGVRVQFVLPPSVAEALKAKAQAEGRTVSSLGSFLIESALRQQQARC